MLHIDTGLSKRAIAVVLSLIEDGIHPEALVDAINEIRDSKKR